MDATAIQTDLRPDTTKLIGVAPLLLLPVVAYAAFQQAAAWELMWSLAVAIYLGLKWLTFATCPLALRASPGRILGYLLLWPGMNARQFLDARLHAPRPKAGEWLLAVAKTAGGFALLYFAVPALIARHPQAAGWAGMAGLIFVAHFGTIHLLSLGWRAAGVMAEPIMNFPILATSLGDFWGRRWNLAFRDAAFGQIFRPLAGRLGIAGATLVVFGVSGVVHDLVISGPVHGGWGGPTFYFALQGVGVLFERSPLGRRLHLAGGFAGRAFCGLVTVGPVALLFHAAFVRGAILPTLAAIGAIHP